MSASIETSRHGSMPVIRVLSLTHDEFFRLLPGAVELPVVHRPGGARGRGWSLTVDVQPALSIAPQALPRLRVSLDFSRQEPDYIAAFMARFDHHFRLAGA